jgi:hypothetical protein
MGHGFPPHGHHDDLSLPDDAQIVTQMVLEFSNTNVLHIFTLQHL